MFLVSSPSFNPYWELVVLHTSAIKTLLNSPVSGIAVIAHVLFIHPKFCKARLADEV
ncbi:MAG: hypothetical protein K2X48_01645 [Chitinophagaceae bacterium]|nr:hypothetical protein [Chitinophagaceae bacterium]